jgi:flavodoxin/Pyruvate/2-oxoacid:ferredoxin oxidoreductase delta subunit
MVYFSQGGTTARVAEAIAVGLHGKKYQADLCNLKDMRPPEPSGYDLLGIGSPVYYFRPPFNVTDYLHSLPDLKGLPTFIFMVSGTYRFDASQPIRSALSRRGAREAGYFHCFGADFYLAYLKEGYLFSPDHPTGEELASAGAFGRQVARHVAGEPYSPPVDEHQPKPVYRMERFFLNRWLTTQVHSRLFRVKRSCSACGLCLKTCPTGNIAKDKGGRPVWGRNCLLCLTCELKCPQDSITSVTDWPFFRPFITYNLRHAGQDTSISHVRVLHSRGHTRRL